VVTCTPPKSSTVPFTGSNAIAARDLDGGDVLGRLASHVAPFHSRVSELRTTPCRKSPPNITTRWRIGSYAVHEVRTGGNDGKGSQVA
jgi:hypothetical protein